MTAANNQQEMQDGPIPDAVPIASRETTHDPQDEGVFGGTQAEPVAPVPPMMNNQDDD
jgi:hypothetical protein